MAKPNYRQQKKSKEQARKVRKEEKLQKRKLPRRRRVGDDRRARAGVRCRQCPAEAEPERLTGRRLDVRRRRSSAGAGPLEPLRGFFMEPSA